MSSYLLHPRQEHLPWLNLKKKHPEILSFHKGFEDTSYNEISVIVIPDLLMNIVSYHGFAKENNPNVILICGRNLVSYHLSESFVILPQNDESIKSFPREVKYCVSKILIHENYSVITCTTVVLSVANTLKNIYLSNNVLLNLF